jgi:hypothetical protein
MHSNVNLISDLLDECVFLSKKEKK